ncbi:MAG: hypothetical protein ACK46N_03855, partial [Dolichospermum sp.]
GKTAGIIDNFLPMFSCSHLLMLFSYPNVAKMNTKTFIAAQRYENALWGIDKISSGVNHP